MTIKRVMEALNREAAYCVGIVISFVLGFGSGHVAATARRGDLGQTCKPDGSCNTARLECRPLLSFVDTGEWSCVLKTEADR